MRTFLLLLVAFVVVALASQEDDVKAQFAAFMVKYNKVYSAEETQTRFENFKASIARASQQLEGSTAQYGVTKFSDMTPEEFASTILMKKTIARDEPVLPVSSRISASVPTFDWREKGAVTAVKDQEQCGSCWAFSATEAIESAWILKGHATATTVNLAPQQIVDCDTIDGVEGCNGGTTESAYAYIQQAGGEEPEADYPYTGENGKCTFNAKDVDAKISGFTAIPKNEETLADTLAATGPLSICLDAAHWQDYSSGVMSHWECCILCRLDHCVQLVGYNTTAATPYWIVRNSWNTDWGVEGYIYLEMGHNTCGLTDDITWPTSQ